MDRKRGKSYKDQFIKNFENANVHPTTINRWKKRILDASNKHEAAVSSDECGDDYFDNKEHRFSASSSLSTSDDPEIYISGEDANQENGEQEEQEHNSTEEDINETAGEKEHEDYAEFIDEETSTDDSNSDVSKDYNTIPDWSYIPNKSLDTEELEKIIMFEAANISVWEVYNMVTCVTLKYNLSDEAQQAILDMVKTFAGPKFNDLNTSKYFIKKLFNPPEKVISYVFYCPSCHVSITTPVINAELKKTQEAMCEKCTRQYNLSLSNDNYFMVIDIQYQLRSLLENSSIRQLIDDQLSIVKNETIDDTIRDVHSSDRYCEDSFIKSKRDNNDKVLTLNVNTDGTPQFESGQHSFWPIQCVINEVPKQFRHKFVLLAALWYTTCEPRPQFMNLYLQLFISQINNIMENGILIEIEDGSFVTYYCKIFCFAVDSVARPIMQNRVQFNGIHGCSWCYIEGQSISRCVRYMVTNEDPPLRTHEKFLKDVKKRRKDIKKLPKTKKNLKYRINGVKGSSVLASLSGFDCIWGYSYDYMHSVLLGVTRQLWVAWSSDFLNAAQIKVINARLLQITPPNEIHRTPRILKKKKTWKATEWRSWLLFYSIPCLTGILEERVLRSYRLLVKSMHVLLSEEMTESELLKCEIDILDFVADSQELYGPTFMTFNVHSLLHTVQSVRKNGPLWATSTYPFENNIYRLKQDVTGPKNIINQIATRALRRNGFLSYLPTTDNKNSWNFCKNIINKRKTIANNFIRDKDDVVLISDKQVPSINNTLGKYNRCIYRGIVYHSMEYTKPKKTDNTCIYLKNGRVARIVRFIFDGEKTLLEVKIAKTEKFQDLDHICVVDYWKENSEYITMLDIINKVILITFTDNKDRPEINVVDTHYACLQPNNIEVQ